MNLSSLASFSAAIPSHALADLNNSCDRPLESSSFCTACTTSLNRIKASYLPGPDVSNVTNCASYPFIYAAAVANRLAPKIPLPRFASSSSPISISAAIPAGIAAGCAVLVLLAAYAVWYYFIHRRRRKRSWTQSRRQSGPLSDQIGASTTLIKFVFDDIRAATGNFSRENIIGQGGFGNVYKGVIVTEPRSLSSVSRTVQLPVIPASPMRWR
ncbi:hypothetical protein HPP92_016874 [Vanilla planifolia]|uniref:SPARK domain-containing protein n=1 Tax=Vanilla planifolia TaxID=51239 RepID=A0A835QID5_VANPL|nr:hypothetical protein HPP92_016874 [Vanilla planifolia]